MSEYQLRLPTHIYLRSCALECTVLSFSGVSLQNLGRCECGRITLRLIGRSPSIPVCNALPCSALFHVPGKDYSFPNFDGLASWPPCPGAFPIQSSKNDLPPPIRLARGTSTLVPPRHSVITRTTTRRGMCRTPAPWRSNGSGIRGRPGPGGSRMVGLDVGAELNGRNCLRCLRWWLRLGGPRWEAP
jgi:hypothetical protein